MSRLHTTPLRRALLPTRSPAFPSRRINTSYRTQDFPFKPPPIRERLRPLIPFFIWWTVLTSLTVHLLRARQAATEADSRSEAKIHALNDLLGRARSGEVIPEEEVQRRLEMVGVRERSKVEAASGVREEVRDVGWREAIFGRKAIHTAKEEEEEVENWARGVVAEANGTGAAQTARRAVLDTPAPTAGGVRRAPSSNRYM